MQKKKPDTISQEDWDAVDFPEIPDDELRQMRPLREKPETLAMLLKAQQALRDQLGHDVETTVQLDPDLARHFMASGGDWQTRVNSVLRAYLRSEVR